MPFPSFPDLSKIDTSNSKQIADAVAKMKKELEWVLEHLDGTNIVANSITANHIQANAIQSHHILAKSVHAEHINVQELSAISANLGYITAGVLTGVVIQTGETGPRIRLIGNTLHTLRDSVLEGPALEYYSYLNSYRLVFYRNNQETGYIESVGSGYLSVTSNSDLYLSAESNISLNAGSYYIHITPYEGVRTNNLERGFCGVGGVGNGDLTAVAGVGVNFKMTKNYSPSTISLTEHSSNTYPIVISINRYGFWLYVDGDGTLAYRYWRGEYYG